MFDEREAEVTVNVNDRVDWPRDIVMMCPICNDEHHRSAVCPELDLLLWSGRES